jgi:hypothetical protein
MPLKHVDLHDIYILFYIQLSVQQAVIKRNYKRQPEINGLGLRTKI